MGCQGWCRGESTGGWGVCSALAQGEAFGHLGYSGTPMPALGEAWWGRDNCLASCGCSQLRAGLAQPLRINGPCAGTEQRW